jgi:hypothetical protein
MVHLHPFLVLKILAETRPYRRSTALTAIRDSYKTTTSNFTLAKPILMVAVSAPSKVLVTGANGYLATWVVKKYLEAGYSVRGTVRSLSKSAFLKDKFAHYGDRFELVPVEDTDKDGAFDEAVKDVDAIAHIASPFRYKSANPDGMSYVLLMLTASGAQDVYRAHHSCRAGNYIDPDLRLRTWKQPETFDPHVFGRGGSRGHHCRARNDSPCVKDAGRESRVEVRRHPWL